MARGRFISKAITTDRKVNNLSSDKSRLGFIFSIVYADKEGRITGEPDLLKSLLFPRRNDITIDEIEGFIQEWADSGFIVLYEENNQDRVIQLINFYKHQIGLRKEREPDSIFDSPEVCRIIAGRLPDNCPVKVEVKEEVKNQGESEGEEEDEEEPVFSSASATPGSEPDIELEGINQFTLDEKIEEHELATIYMNVTGNLGLPVKAIDRKTLIEALREIYYTKKDQTTEYLKPFFTAWCDRKYSKTNPGWLDWAIAGEIKEKKNSSNQKEFTKADEESSDPIARFKNSINKGYFKDMDKILGIPEGVKNDS